MNKTTRYMYKIYFSFALAGNLALVTYDYQVEIERSHSSSFKALLAALLANQKAG
ncbi:MAG: hypothetical protein ACI9O6_000565 [Glaciecola sp.]|jgi:hypothetical protein